MSKGIIRFLKQFTTYGVIIIFSVGMFTGCKEFNSSIFNSGSKNTTNGGSNIKNETLSGVWEYRYFEAQKPMSMLSDVSVYFKLVINSIDGNVLNGSYYYEHKYSGKNFLKQDSGRINVQIDYTETYSGGSYDRFNYYLYLGDSDYGGSNARLGFSKDGSVYLHHDWITGSGYVTVPKIK